MKTIKELRAKHWGDKPAVIFSSNSHVKVHSWLMLAQAHVLADISRGIRNRIKMYAASPRAVAAIKREAEQAESDARDVLRGAYGYR